MGSDQNHTYEPLARLVRAFWVKHEQPTTEIRMPRENKPNLNASQIRSFVRRRAIAHISNGGSYRVTDTINSDGSRSRMIWINGKPAIGHTTRSVKPLP